MLFQHLYHQPALEVDDLMDQMLALRERVRPYVGDAVGFVHRALKEGKTVLLEGQLGSMKDRIWASSHDHLLPHPGRLRLCGRGGPPHRHPGRDLCHQGLLLLRGLPDRALRQRAHRPGGDELRRRGGDKGEFGATTGRPRRVGWFDAVATRYGCMIQGATQVALTCLDVLGYLDEIQVCTGYEIDGKVTDVFPTTPDLLKAKPVFTTLPGWKCDIRVARTTTPCPPTPGPMWTFWRPISAPPSLWSPAAPSGRR